MTNADSSNNKGSGVGAKVGGWIGIFAFVITFGTLLTGAVIGIYKLAMMIWRSIFGS